MLVQYGVSFKIPHDKHTQFTQDDEILCDFCDYNVSFK